MLRTLAFATLVAVSAVALSGLGHGDHLVQDATAECTIVLDDGSCFNKCDPLDPAAEAYRKATGDDIYCTM